MKRVKSAINIVKLVLMPSKMDAYLAILLLYLAKIDAVIKIALLVLDRQITSVNLAPFPIISIYQENAFQLIAKITLALSKGLYTVISQISFIFLNHNFKYIRFDS